MAVDFFELSAGSSEFDQQAQPWPQPNGANRPHLKLYERNSLSNLQTPQSPVAGASDFGCWSPASNPDDEISPKPVWSNGDWMQNSSSENSTTSSTEDYDLDLYPNGQCNRYQQQAQNYQWQQGHPTTQPTNDENLLSQMLALTLDTDCFRCSTNPSNVATRKWSQDGDASSAGLRPQIPMNKSCPVSHYNHYAPYIQQQQQPMPRVSNSSVDECLPPQFISPTNAKWSTAQESAPILNTTKSAPNFGYPHQNGCFKQRQIFGQLNASNSSPHRIQQKPSMSCDEAEIQWYHRHLELQQSVYDQIYSKVLSGELKKKQANKSSQPSNDFHPVQTPNLDRSNSIPSSSAQSSPVAIELAAKLEQCTAQYRQLEKERKKTEAELAKHHLGKKISSSNNLQIPRLPTAPSRIDRLVVDFFREHARVITLLCRMEELRGVQFDQNLHKVMLELLDSIRLLQQRRLSERNSILSHLSGELGFYNEESELANQKDALVMLTRAAIRARSANWCALIQTLGAESQIQQMQLERVQTLEYKCEPPEFQARPLNVQNSAN
ncbi:hypothetical protein M3Y97_00924300 [Aphelenchoides bicaudatus]|nr:hypothetical protein M3Y97_00924300 [Aphelenchoides bicaudatus]